MTGYLPPCNHRVELPKDHHFHCRHPQVQGRAAEGGLNVVTDSVCLGCLVRNQGVEAPRPAPAATPNAAEMALNFAKAAARHAMAGGKKATDEVRTQRLAICQECEFCESQDDVPFRCHHCGCYLQLKTGWASEHCPLAKW